jgi:hypothetical protein
MPLDLATLTVFALLSTTEPGAMPMRHQPFADALLHPPRLTQSGPSSQGKPARDSLKNGTLIGLAVGVVSGVFLGGVGCSVGDILSESGEESDCTGASVLGAVIFGAAGAGIGAGIDALFERAPSVGGAPTAHRKGVRVRFSF